jgi:predicted protein tyrosine phosphatase
MRSKTAEVIFSNREDLEVRSAGTEDDADVVVTEEMLAWADVIFIMEEDWQVPDLERKFPELYPKKKVVCLHLADIYNFMDSELVRLLKLRVEWQLTKL